MTSAINRRQHPRPLLCHSSCLVSHFVCLPLCLYHLLSVSPPGSLPTCLFPILYLTPPVCLPLLSVSPLVCLPSCLSSLLSVSALVFLSSCLYLPFSLSVCLSICLSGHSVDAPRNSGLKRLMGHEERWFLTVFHEWKLQLSIA